MDHMFALVVTSGPAADLRIEVVGDLVLGREGADVTVPDPEASRRHAVVRPAAGGLEIEDLGSSNGTFVNDARISGPTRLAAGDRIRIGASSIQVESDEAPTAETVVSPIPEGDAISAQATVAAPTPTAPPAAGPPTAPAVAPDPGAALVAASPYAGPASPRRAPRLGRADTRRLGPTAFSFGMIVVTAIALILYFLLR
jgi:pSer/pThr/pTyr-binding forkhead associated (FHA) protein